MPSYLEMTYVILITGFVEFKYLYFKIYILRSIYLKLSIFFGNSHPGFHCYY